MTLVDAMMGSLNVQPQLNNRVASITIDRTLPQDDNMTVTSFAEGAQPPVLTSTSYNAVFNTTTLGCAQRMDLTGLGLFYEQKDVLRSLHYDVSTKVAIVFSEPWWLTECGITQGGTANTDLPLRSCVYPSYNLHDGPDQKAVLLASYTWAQDAQRMASLTTSESPVGEDELKALLIHDLALLHPQVTEAQLNGWYVTHQSWAWSHDPYTSGAFALFGPGQFASLYPYLTRPTADSKFYFAGEAASAHHAWIVGALNSAYAAVYSYLTRYAQTEKLVQLVTQWGGSDESVLHDELETGEYGTQHLQVLLGQANPQEHVRVGPFIRSK